MKKQSKLSSLIRRELNGYWWLEKEEYSHIQHALEKLTKSCDILPANIKKKFLIS
jgi:hypothetical protein